MILVWNQRNHIWSLYEIRVFIYDSSIKSKKHSWNDNKRKKKCMIFYETKEIIHNPSIKQKKSNMILVRDQRNRIGLNGWNQKRGL